MENNIEIYGNIIDVAKVKAFQNEFKGEQYSFLTLTLHYMKKFEIDERPLFVISKEVEKLCILYKHLNILFGENENEKPSETTNQ